MPAIVRKSDEPYRWGIREVLLAEVANEEQMPQARIHHRERPRERRGGRRRMFKLTARVNGQ
jgi:hypothetical protein